MVPGWPQVLIRMTNPMRYRSAEYMESIAGLIYGGSLRTSRIRAREHVRLMKPPSWKGYCFQLLSIVGWSSLPWLHRLEQPTLVMAGDDDPLVPLVNARMLAGLIPGAQLQVVDCGHLFLLTRAKKLAPQIEQFIA